MMIRAGIAGLTLVIGASFAAYLVRPIPDQAISLPSFIASPDPITPEPTPEPIIPNPTLHGIATHYDAERKGETTWYTRAGIKFYGAAGPDLRAEVPHRWRNKYRVLVTSERTGRSASYGSRTSASAEAEIRIRRTIVSWISRPQYGTPSGSRSISE
jgi:hypothetical protein